MPVVIESREKSGTQITVDMALEQGKEVYALPGRITDTVSRGCNKLIKQGAGILLSPREFVEEICPMLKLKYQGKEVKVQPSLSNEEKRISVHNYYSSHGTALGTSNEANCKGREWTLLL